ncbi:MAG: alcohol dehydrogenase catalytic domain-containing protein [Sphingomonadaceae bacterium]
MQQLYFLSPGSFEWRDVAAPRIRDDRHAIVRPLAVARCDLDLYIALGAAPFAGPFAFGHEAIGEVVEAGDKSGVKPGDRVVVPFQISCGDCDNCRRGYTNSCSAVPLYSAYGLASKGRQDFGGALADLMLVPYADHMLVPLPPEVDPVMAASACDNIADGWRGVAPHLLARPGASVLVIGGLAQSVGIYAAGSAVALGAGRVLYLDDNDINRTRAAAMGAEVAPLALGDGRQADDQFEIVVEAAGSAPALAFAVRSTAANGVLTSVSMHFDATTPVPLTQAYYKGLTFHTGRVQSRPLLPAILGCIACGTLHPEHVTHRMAPFAEAGDAMTDPGPKLVFVP